MKTKLALALGGAISLGLLASVAVPTGMHSTVDAAGAGGIAALETATTELAYGGSATAAQPVDYLPAHDAAGPAWLDSYAPGRSDSLSDGAQWTAAAYDEPAASGDRSASVDSAFDEAFDTPRDRAADASAEAAARVADEVHAAELAGNQTQAL